LFDIKRYILVENTLNKRFTLKVQSNSSSSVTEPAGSVH
jgi:hypothetical protein